MRARGADATPFFKEFTETCMKRLLRCRIKLRTSLRNPMSIALR